MNDYGQGGIADTLTTTRYMPNAHSPLAFSIFPLTETALSFANLTVNPYNLLG